MRRLLLLAAVALLAVLAPREARAQLNLDPIPLSELKGATIEVPELNFAVTAPDGWVWKGKSSEDREKPTQYVCMPAEGGAVITVAIVAKGLYSKLDDDGARQTVEGVISGMSKGGRMKATLVDGPKLVDTPLAGESYAFVVRGDLPNGKVVYSHMQVASRASMYTMTQITASSDPPPELKEVARSFRLLDPRRTAAFERGRLFGTLIAPILCCGSFFGVVAVVIYLVVRKKPGAAPPKP